MKGQYPSHLIIWLDGPELHHQLKTQQVVCADGLQLQQLAQSHQLRPLEVLQRQLVLKQLRKPNNVLCGGLLTCASHLKRTKKDIPDSLYLHIFLPFSTTLVVKEKKGNNMQTECQATVVILELKYIIYLWHCFMVQNIGRHYGQKMFNK